MFQGTIGVNAILHGYQERVSVSLQGTGKSTDGISDELSALRKRISELEEAHLEKDRLLSAFNSISLTLHSSLDLDTILDSLSQQIIAAGLFRSLMIAIVDHEQQVVRTDRGFEIDQERRISKMAASHADIGITYSIDDKDILSETVRTGKMQVAEGWDSRFTPRTDMPVESYEGQVAYFVPVKQQKRVFAVLATGSKAEEKDFLLSRIEMMQPLLDQIAIALERSQLHADIQKEIVERKQVEQALRKSEIDLKHRVDQQEALLRIGHAVQEMTTPKDLEYVLKTCLDEVGRLGLDVQAMAIHRVLDPEEMWIETFRVGPEGTITAAERRKGETIISNWRNGEIEYLQDLEDAGEQDKTYFRSKFNNLPLRSFFDVPFSRGVISAHSIRPNAFSDSDEEVLKQVAEIYSVGFARLDDLEKIEDRNRELIRLERLRAAGELSVGVSHNLNNILTSIVGPAQILQHQTDDPKLRKLIEMIYQSSIRATDLVNRLHLATKGITVSKLEDVNVNKIILESIEATRPRWKDELESVGITITIETDLVDTPPVYGNESELNDIFINLIFNAVDAMPEGGKISFSTRSTSSGTRIVASDTGKGMDEETRRKVFEPFFTTKMDVGSGLGLSTVYGSITRWGGTISVESGPGEGTIFVIDIPIGQAGASDTGTAHTPRSHPGGQILIVEDDKDVSWFLSHLLSDHHTMRIMPNGNEALSSFSSGMFDVAVIDLGLPGIPGDQVARELRRIDPTLATVLVTGWRLEQDDPRLEPFDFVLLKPFVNNGEVSARIDQAIDLHNDRLIP